MQKLNRFVFIRLRICINKYMYNTLNELPGHSSEKKTFSGLKNL